MHWMRCGQGVFFCQTRSCALRFLRANSHKRLRAAHGNAPSGWEESCHGQLSRSAIEVPFRSHRTVFSIFLSGLLPRNPPLLKRGQGEAIWNRYFPFREAPPFRAGSFTKKYSLTAPDPQVINRNIFLIITMWIGNVSIRLPVFGCVR